MKVFDIHKFHQAVMEYDEKPFVEFYEKFGFCNEPRTEEEEGVLHLCGPFFSFLKTDNSDDVDLSLEELLDMADSLDDISNIVFGYGVLESILRSRVDEMKSSKERRRVI